MIKFILILLLTVSAFAQRTQNFNADKYQFGPSLPALLGAEIGVFKYADLASFPVTGAVGALYLDKDTNKLYRWDDVGAEYALISGGGLSNWITANEYKIGDVVINDQAIYQANADHTSTTFSADSANWTPIGLAGPASSTDNAIARFDGTTGKVIQNSGATISDTGDVSANSFSAPSTSTTSSFSGIQINNNQITAASGANLDLSTGTSTGTINAKRRMTFQFKKLHSAYNDPTSGSNATLEDHTTAFVRLTASGNLVSIDGIPAGNGGDQRTILNLTGSSVTINNESGATAANRILTGTGGNLKIKNNGSINIMYDITQQRWFVTGGVGGSSGLGDTDTMFVQDFEGAVSGDFATLTGWALNLSSPLHGDVDLKVTHATATTTYTVKQSITVPAKFKGKNNTIKLTAKSSSAADNLVLDLGCATDTDLLSGELIQFDSGTGGEESYHSFDLPSTCTNLSYTVRALPETGPPVTSIDDIEIKLTEVEVMSALVQDPDMEISYYSIFGTNASGYGTTPVTGSVYTSRFLTNTVNIGNNGYVTVADSAASGTTFTVNDTGVYSVSCSATNTGTADGQIYIMLDLNMKAEQRFSAEGGEYTGNVAWTGIVSAGTVVRCAVGGASVLTNANTTEHHFTISRQGSLKQATVNKNQKIKIPTSIVRFEGSSSKGAVATSIVKFDAITRLRGDAFEIVSDSNNGTYVKMKKAGKIFFSTSLNSTAAANVSVSKNQSVLTAYPVSGETIGNGHSYGADRATASGSDIVDVNDIIRVNISSGINASYDNILIITFQEQEVQVSVSNTLPQFSESDLLVRAHSNAGGAVTNNVTDIPFTTTVTDSTGGNWNGSAFTVPENGTYSISGSMYFTTAASRQVNLFINGSFYRYVGGEGSSTYNAFSYTDSFTKGQVLSLRLAAGGGTLNTSSSSGIHYITITKIGKPNVTGVDVTPFVQLPMIEGEYLNRAGATTGSSASALLTFNSSTFKNTTGSVIRYDNDAVNGDKITCLRFKCKVFVGFSVNAIAWSNASGEYRLLLNDTSGSSAATLDYFNLSVGSGGGPENNSAKLAGVYEINRGDVLRIYGNANANFNIGGTAWLIVSGEAIQETIVTPTESFSTDTATLVHKTSAVTASDPVGTFSTYSYAASSNTRSVCASAPTQTVDDMKVNGIRVYARQSYTGGSVCATPSVVVINIGKGFKGLSLNGYGATGKTLPVSLDFHIYSTIPKGMAVKSYNETTGLLTLDAGQDNGPSQTSWSFFGSEDNSNYTSAFISINASKTPTLSGISYVAPRVAFLSDVKASGTQGGSAVLASWSTRTLNTEDDQSDFLTLSGSQFTLQSGEYIVEGCAPFLATTNVKTRIRNITDSSTVIGGSSEYASTANQHSVKSCVSGRFTISAQKVFELQYYASTAAATNGLGNAVSSGESEVYSQLKITKVK